MLRQVSFYPFIFFNDWTYTSISFYPAGAPNVIGSTIRTDGSPPFVESGQNETSRGRPRSYRGVSTTIQMLSARSIKGAWFQGLSVSRGLQKAGLLFPLVYPPNKAW